MDLGEASWRAWAGVRRPIAAIMCGGAINAGGIFAMPCGSVESGTLRFPPGLPLVCQTTGATSEKGLGLGNNRGAMPAFAAWGGGGGGGGAMLRGAPGGPYDAENSGQRAYSSLDRFLVRTSTKHNIHVGIVLREVTRCHQMLAWNLAVPGCGSGPGSGILGAGSGSGSGSGILGSVVAARVMSPYP
eukprot:COSAG06_NODE_3768_length_4927_cov_3.657208_1_plen_187_part_10